MQNRRAPSLARSLSLATFLALAALASGCNKQSYVVATNQAFQSAPGNFVIQPKIDILLAEDDTGSMYEAYSQIATQMPAFLTQLESKGWDYHFATIPLTTDRALDQVLASKHDANWGFAWRAPYPGAVPWGPGTIDPSVFAFPERYSRFLTYADISNSGGGLEPGLENIRKALYERTPGTNFLRNDALTVILVVGNGEDTSKVNMCTRSDGFRGPCEDVGYPACSTANTLEQNQGLQCGTKAQSFAHYKTLFQGLKPSPRHVQFHAAVSNYRYSSCLGGSAYPGFRYKQMAGDLAGGTYDICSQPVSTVLDTLAGRLQVQKIAYRTRYLFIDREPDVATIRVVRYVGGNASQAVEIAQDPVNGWTYAGHVTDVHAIDSPIPMNLGSGFAIELHGDAKLHGDDTANVTFKPAGAQNSSSG